MGMTCLTRPKKIVLKKICKICEFVESPLWVGCDDAV